MSGAVRQGFRAFVGNLPWTIGSHELRVFGSSFGPVLNSTVVFDKNTGISKGYGFLTFATREALNSATAIGAGSAGSHFLEGNYVNVQPSINSNQNSSNNNNNNAIAAE